MPRWWAAVIGGCVLAATLVTLAAPASAFPGVERQVAETPFDKTTPKIKSASCPLGKVVIGGGGEVTGGLGNVVLNRLTPVQATNRFEVRADRATPNWDGSWQLSVYAICSNPIPGLEFRTERDTEGTKVHSTGASLNTNSNQEGHIVMDEIIPNAALTGVSATAYPDVHNPPPGWSINSYAICAT